jgi:hypothetical protein
VELGLRNVRFERYGDLPPTLAGKHLLIAGNPLLESLQLEALSTLHSLAILGNPSLPQCLLDLTLAAITLDAPSEIAENNTACTCTEEAPYTATCDEPPPPDSEGEEPPMP